MVCEIAVLVHPFFDTKSKLGYAASLAKFLRSYDNTLLVMEEQHKMHETRGYQRNYAAEFLEDLTLSSDWHLQ